MNKLVWAGLALSVGLTGCGGGGGAPVDDAGNIEPLGNDSTVTITRTKFGIPHIKASDYRSLGFGQGYAFAQDNLCVFMEDLLTIRGERSKFFGPDGSYTIEPNGSTANNVDSDFFWKSLFAYEDPADGLNAWQKTEARTMPNFQDVVDGYAQGVNQYITALKAGELTYETEDGEVSHHAACADKDWIQPIESADLYRRFVRLSVLASSSVFVGEIGSTQPPAGLPLSPDQLGAATATSDSADFAELAKAALQNNPNPLVAMQERDKFGSNMYAFGADGTQDRQSLVYGNPHFPWRGTERLYLSHNTLEMNGETKMDIMGVGLYGVPAVLIGFNEKLAWSHTVSTAYRFTLYQLDMNPQNPLQYMKDGEPVDLIALPTEIEVLQEDGSLTTQERTIYRSEYGPMLKLEVEGVPVLDWNQFTAFTVRDANLENDRLINQFAQWNEAESLDNFIELHGEVLGVPWVNTVASGPNQQAYYGDVTVVPNVTDELTADCKREPFHSVIQVVSAGLPVLDGSRSGCAWGNDTDAPAPGIFGPGNLPTLERDDYVTNCNDSYWLTNPADPITGFDRIIGDEATERTLRTRLCILQAERRLAGADEFSAEPLMTQELLKDIALNSEIYSATLAKQEVLDTLCQLPGLIGTSGPVETAAACTALEGWDGKANLDSKGAHLWRAFWKRVVSGPSLAGMSAPVGIPELPLAGGEFGVPLAAPTNTWTTQFSAENPVETPRGLNPANLFLAVAFADAIAEVSDSGFAFDEPLGNMQFSDTHTNEKIPVIGGSSRSGAFTIARTETQTPVLTEAGYKVDYGNSYIQAVTWETDASGVIKPKADAILTYSNSTDPASPHFDDYTKAYAQKQWYTLPFTEDEIAQEQISQMVLRVPAAGDIVPAEVDQATESPEE